MPFIVMYSPDPNAKTYDEVISCGGGEGFDNKEYVLSGEARAVAKSFSLDCDAFSYIVVPITIDTKRALNK